MKIAVFGTGKYYSIYKKWFINVEIAAFLDNDKSKQGKLLDGVPIISPDEILTLKIDRIYIMSHYINEMCLQLKELGIPDEKIYYTYDLAELGFGPELEMPVEIYSDTGKTRILLISDDLKLNGAQYALFYTAQFLKKAGYEIVIASPVHGKMEENFKNNKIPTIIDERIMTGKLADLFWVQGFQLIFINTVTYYNLLLNRDLNVPVVWWLHEPECFVKKCLIEGLRKIDNENLHIIASGGVSKKALLKYNEHFSVDLLTVGVPKTRYAAYKGAGDKFVILVVGPISHLKGQDIVVEAVNQLTEKERSGLEVRFVGRTDSGYDASFADIMEKSGILKKAGELSQDKVHMEYERCDVLICASREEVWPMVVIEAMQHKVMSIVSDAAGITEYLTDGQNALIFPSENAELLAEKMRWCMNNRRFVKMMGERAYEIYEQFFSMEVFEENLLSVIQDSLQTEGEKGR